MQRQIDRRRPRRRSVALPLLFAAVLIFGAGALALTAGTATLWWLTNTQPPVVKAEAPAGPQRGALTLPVTIQPAARADLAGITLDGSAPPEGALKVAGATAPPTGAWASWWSLVHGGPGTAQSGAMTLTLDTAKLPDGAHTLQVQARDRSRRRNATTASTTVTTDNTPPTLTALPVEPHIAAGRPLLLRVAANEPATLRATWGGEPLPLLPAGGATSGATPGATGAGPNETAMLAIVAVPIDTAAGERTVQVDGQDRAGNAAHLNDTLKIDAVNHPRQLLDVPPELAPLATGPVATAESEKLVALTSTVRAERLWHGPFRTPVPPGVPRTTDFGERRDYADGYITYHAGYDLAVPLATPVLAPADGIVVFSGQMQQRGNCIVVDHGWGVYTVYGHLSQIGVQEGQAVTQGQTIGLVGTTGLSTGPHLHWEVRLRGLPVDPSTWLALTAQLGA
jgi:murein DD-endopeptidase MepM/ murein hydrolase activator NlpD